MSQWTALLCVLTIVVGCTSQPGVVAPRRLAVPAEAHELNGIQYRDLVIGTGEEMAPHRCVYTHYTGWLADGTRFESSRDTMGNGVPGEPVAFPQGTRHVIDAWDIGFSGMRVGGKRRLYVPYEFGYGATGNPPSIPPRSDLIFDVDLLAVAVPVRNDEAFATRSDPVCPPWRVVRDRIR